MAEIDVISDSFQREVDTLLREDYELLKRLANMKRFCVCMLLLGFGFTPEAPAQALQPLRLLQTIPLPNVKGRIDHLAIDVKGQRLFVAALGNDTVEVIDLRTGKPKLPLTGFRHPQGVLFLPEINWLIVASGGDGTCRLLDGTSLQTQKTIQLGGDADNMRFEPHEQRLYVGYRRALGLVDVRSGTLEGQIELEGHPESFQIGASQMFVNVPDVASIAVIDRARRVVVAAWPLRGAAGNFPMAMDEANHRLFVGCRHPDKLLVMDTASGALVATLDSVGDADDIFYDAQRQRIYVSGGAGGLQVVEQVTANEYRTLATLPTARGARTSLFVPELQELFVAVPHYRDQIAEIRIYHVES